MEKLLIIANSGRMLAKAACDSGFKPVVVDCFADTDTQTLASVYYQVASLAINDIQAVVDSLKNHFTHCLYGSGFEAHQESLYFLAQHFQLLGNSPNVFSALHDKRDFFLRLQKLAINFPPVFFQKNTPNRSKTPNHSHAPAWECLKGRSASRAAGAAQTAFPHWSVGTRYLVKPFNSQGGVNIQIIQSNKKNKPQYPHYYQQYLNGKNLSVLFIANGKHTKIIGFNQQWIEALSKQQPFIFSGIINDAELSKQHQQSLINWIDKLTASYGLKGLCSLDFILYKNKCYVLEINPRPPASMQLYGKNLLAAHLKACGANLGGFQNLRGLKHYTAYQIIYAPTKIHIPSPMKWQPYCCDLPQTNAIIPKGQPICSMITHGTNPQKLREDLQDKQQLLIKQLQAKQHD